jgi:hypothetical protein
MTFGKQSGPPASSKQLNYLLSLVQKEGFTEFRRRRSGGARPFGAHADS